jgi:hypothetical protein
MPRPKNPVPKPRPHSSGQARVTIDGMNFLLGGPLGSPEAERAYRRIVAQWLAREGPFAQKLAEDVTVAELVAAYWLVAERYYGFDVNPQRGTPSTSSGRWASWTACSAPLPPRTSGPST